MSVGIRIRELANLFPRGSCLVDIGSDHGYLGLELLNSNRASAVVNIDLSRDALNRSFLSYKRKGLENHARFIFNDGFNGLWNWPKNSVVVISGMGTIQILKILENLPEQMNHLIFLSHTEYYGLRRWAYHNSFQIVNEKYLEDGKHIYLIVEVVREKLVKTATIRDLIFGREEFWMDRQLFNKYWRKISERILNIPYQFRNEIENETIRALRMEGVI